MSTPTLHDATPVMVRLDRATPRRRQHFTAARPVEPAESTLPSTGAPPWTLRVPVHADRAIALPQARFDDAPFFGDGGPAAQPGIRLPLSSAVPRAPAQPASAGRWTPADS